MIAFWKLFAIINILKSRNFVTKQRRRNRRIGTNQLLTSPQKNGTKKQKSSRTTMQIFRQCLLVIFNYCSYVRMNLNWPLTIWSVNSNPITWSRPNAIRLNWTWPSIALVVDSINAWRLRLVILSSIVWLSLLLLYLFSVAWPYSKNDERNQRLLLKIHGNIGKIVAFKANRVATLLFLPFCVLPSACFRFRIVIRGGV